MSRRVRLNCVARDRPIDAGAARWLADGVYCHRCAPPIPPDIEGPDPDDLQPDIPSPSVNPVNPINSVKNSEEEKP